MQTVTNEIKKSMEGSSWIRKMFEKGIELKKTHGADAVCDFSLGNPDVPPPAAAKAALEAIAADAVKPLGLGRHVVLTVGAAGALVSFFRAVIEPGDEVICPAPYFVEYASYCGHFGGILKPVDSLPDEGFRPDFDAMERAITPHTRAILVNSPNNPSGVVLSERTIISLVEILKKKSEEFSHPVFLISDEPYRELVYDGINVPYLTKYYDDTIVCYSFSKSLSLPDEVTESERVFKAVCGAGRSLGYVCAPSLFQFVVGRCVGHTGDISIYKKNRDLLLFIFKECGFEVAKPDGAFYLFLKSPDKDASSFAEKAKKFELLLVPSDSFGFPGYVRVASCVSTEMIERSASAFRKLAQEYR